MGIMGMIAKAKEGFRDMTVERRKQLALQETERLRREKIRMGELAKAQAEQARLEKDVKNISSFTEKHRVPTTMQKFAHGLQKTVNAGKKATKGLHPKGLSLGAPASSGSRGLNNSGQGSPFGASRNLDVGGNSGGFTFGPSPKIAKPKQKSTTIIIKQ